MAKQMARTALVLVGLFLIGGCGPSKLTTPTAPTAVQATPVATKPAIPSATTQTPPINSGTPASSAAGTPTAATEQPVATETNPVGDISDTQAFVKFTSPTGGFAVQVPEGWARTDQGKGARFVSKLDGVEVALADAAAAPTAATARANEVAALQKSGHAVQITQVQDVKLPSGSAVFVEYSSNSLPDAVTGKQVRLENNAYYFFKNGKLATLTLWAPLGADNVDQWKQIATSFGWQ